MGKQSRLNGQAHNAKAQSNSVAAHDPESESLLACELLLNPDSIPAVTALIIADDIYRPMGREICRSIFNLHRAGIEIDAATIADDLLHRGKLDEIGGADQIIEMLDRNYHGLHAVRHSVRAGGN